MNKRKFYQDIGSDDELCDRQSMTSSQEDLTSHSTYDMDCYDNDTGQLDNLLANTNLSPILDPSLMEKKRLKLEINEHISINEIIEHISVHASAAKDFRSQYLVLVKTLHGIKLKIDIRHSMTNDSISVGELKQLILEVCLVDDFEFNF